MKTKNFTLVVFLLMSFLLSAQVEEINLIQGQSPVYYYFCETTTSSVIVHKPINSGMGTFSHPGLEDLSQDSVIITTVNQGYWFWNYSGIITTFYVYFVNISPTESWVSSDTMKCVESTITLNAQTNHQSDFTYEWNTGWTYCPLDVSIPGTYFVTVTGACGVIVDQIDVINYESPVPDLGQDRVDVCSWDTLTLNPGIFVNYEWSNGSTNPTIQVYSTDNYSVIVTDDHGCLGYDTVSIDYYVNPGISLAVLTIDTTNGNNRVVWNTDIPDFQNHTVNIYRNGATNDMNFIGNVSYLDGGFTDVVNSTQRTWRYAISANDDCGNWSPMSPYHESMKITLIGTIGGGVQVEWTPYGMESKSVSSYRIYSVQGYGNAWIPTEIEVVPGTQTSYNFPASNDSLYVVGAVIQGAKSTPTLALSVMQNPIITGINDELQDTKFTFYPNPSNGTIFFDGEGTLQVYNAIGQCISNENLTGKISLTMKSGFYTVKFTDKNKTTTIKKVIVN